MFKSLINAGKIFSHTPFLTNTLKLSFSLNQKIPYQNLDKFDPKVYKIIKLEEDR